MISVEGVVVVRAATERFLAELSVVVRLWGVWGAGGPVAFGRRITAPRPARRADWGLVNVDLNVHHYVHRRKSLNSLGPVNVVNVVNVFPYPLSCARARARTRKG